MAETLPNLPEIGLEFEPSKIISEALVFTRSHCNDMTYNHVVRSAYWASIIGRKHPAMASSDVDMENVVLSCVLHDMGWAETKELLSADKRFEVDGANIARDFITKFKADNAEDGSAWDSNRIQRCWDAIALHTTFSIAQYAAPEVALAAFGILADFLGPSFPPGGPKLVTLEEYHAVMKLFPRAGFTVDGFTSLMCGLCRDKAASTHDNFVAEFGSKFGVDGAGGGKEEFSRAREESNVVHMLLGSLGSLEKLDAGQ